MSSNRAYDSILVRPMTEKDWKSVCKIFEEGMATGQASFETSVPAWSSWDASHHRHSRLVACDAAGGVVGWAALSPASARACYAGVAEVSIYVAERCREHGVGKRLMQEVISSSEKNGIWTLYSITFSENERSLRMQESVGFRRVGIRKKIAELHGVWRDTVLSERRSNIVGVE